MPDLEATRRATCATHFQRSTRFKTGRLEHPSLPSNCVTGTSREDFEDLKARSSSQRCEGLCLLFRPRGTWGRCASCRRSSSPAQQHITRSTPESTWMMTASRVCSTIRSCTVLNDPTPTYSLNSRRGSTLVAACGILPHVARLPPALSGADAVQPADCRAGRGRAHGRRGDRHCHRAFKNANRALVCVDASATLAIRGQSPAMGRG